MSGRKSRSRDSVDSGSLVEVPGSGEYAESMWKISHDNVTFFCGEPDLDKIIWPKVKTDNMPGGRL